MSPRPRERILTNLEVIYREAYEQASELGDKDRMSQLDASFQREQLILEVLLDIRDALVKLDGSSMSKSALDKLDVDIHLFRAGEYKSAGEPLVRDNMSDADREANRAWLATLWEAYKNDIAAMRRRFGSRSCSSQEFPYIRHRKFPNTECR